KKRFLGIFPKPGVSQKDIDDATKFGRVILPHLNSANYSTLQKELLDKGAVKIKPFLITVDKRANVIFGKWANFIHSKSEKGENKRSLLIKFFNFYLIFAIWVMAPIVFIIFLLTYLPLWGKIKKEKQYFSSVVIKE
ncbi:MAG: dialkylresorcinol condensing enzyme DarA, partial [Mangrovimonas sp.]|nr:dialkylresorcinol condensing enzyme DarA [Mangrovimonas sp.]